MSNIFKTITSSQDRIVSNYNTVQVGSWNSTGSLVQISTSSVQSVSSKNYYYQCTDGTYDIFSVSYGHINGSGSVSESGIDGFSPSSGIYKQYSNILLGNVRQKFQFHDKLTSDDIYVISYNRNTLNDGIDTNLWELNLQELNGRSYANIYYTGSNVQVSSSNKTISLIPNTDTGSVSNNGIALVSGSIANGIYDENEYYGLIYKENGHIVLRPNKLNDKLSFNTVTASVAGDNSYKLFTSVSGSLTNSEYFTSRSTTGYFSTYIFARLLSTEYNYTTNPTFRDSTGQVRYESFYDNPVTYITGIGLYNLQHELVAIAKLSKPQKKTFTNELTFQIKLNY